MCQPSGSVFSFSWLALIFIFTLACDKSNISPDENLGEELTKQAAMHQVSQDLYRVIAEDQGAQNFAISPVSIQLALYMVYNGSEGETREEIGQMLQVMDADLEALNQRVKQVQDYLTGLIDEGYLDIHNALFYDENRVELAEAFVDRLSSYYDIHKDNLNFDDPAAVEAINAWVKDKTYDKIEQVLQDISEEEVLFLINALYLKADWVNGFLQEATSDKPFTTTTGNEIMVPTMHQTTNVEHLTREGAVIARLPLADSALFVYLIMPDNPGDLEDLFDSDFMKDLWENNLEFQSSRFRFEMPLVEIKTHLNLNETLQSLGMVTAFNPEKAELSQMGESKSGLPLHISRTLHDVYLRMDERGVEGAAVTTVGVGVTSLPPALQFNKPFAYLIVDQQYNIPVFMGQFTGIEAKN
ncbi:MAG TPA: serpin family protein [Membranihabitans sp.]|nr:serpin family protein [Membranihabitans sp.]